MARKRLGKGLDALLGVPDGAQEVTELKLGELRPGSHQPREGMEDARLRELAASIKETGVLQPIIARRGAKGGYEIVVGERRWRAARLAGLKSIPVVLRDVTDSDALAMALVENLQREDLNPIEKARAFRRLIDSLELNQTQAAKRLGVGRAALSNTLRLLELPSQVKEMVASGRLTAGHARALLMAKDPARIRSLAGRIIAEGLSVRQAEQLAGGRPRGARPVRSRRPAKPAQIVALEQELSRLLGTRVKVESGTKGGRLVLEFYSPDDFESLVAVLRKGARPAAEKLARRK
jgi:ParB family chromosome partitioning protein